MRSRTVTPTSWTSLLVVCAIASSCATLVSAHGGDDDGHATVIEGDGTYAEIHMAQEHHMDNFDIQAFFHLHDLNRDGILDRNELESIYGVHHEKAKKASGGSVEVHTQKAREIVQVVLDKLDTNGDGVLTMREFVAGGVGGLPNFAGVEHLGHHYDAEGEYFLHHEEKYHNTPETQTEESYIHPEDIEHFMQHEQIEAEEEERVREFQGLTDEGEEPVAAPGEGLRVGPRGSNSGGQVVLDNNDNVRPAEGRGVAAPAAPRGQGRQPPPPAPGSVDAAAEDARLKRQERARAQAAKFGKDVNEAHKRGEWGSDNFGRPKDSADRLRKNVPYKFKLKKSWWGEF